MKEKKESIFRADRLRAGGSWKRGRRGQSLALSVSGGELFLIVYLALVLTFGFTLLSSDIAIGRKTQKSAIGAYEEMQPKWKFLGILTFLVPVLIMTYYAVIAGLPGRFCAAFHGGDGVCRV